MNGPGARPDREATDSPVASRILPLSDLVAGAPASVDGGAGPGSVMAPPVELDAEFIRGSIEEAVPKAPRVSAPQGPVRGRGRKRNVAKSDGIGVHAAFDGQANPPAARETTSGSLGGAVANRARPVDPQQGLEPSQSDEYAPTAEYEGLFASGDAHASRKQRATRPPLTTTQRAIGLLSRREHSRKELTRKLVTRGLDPAEVAASVAKLAEAQWQSDDRFAASLVRARASGGYGPRHLRAELATHDLPTSARDAAFDAFEGDWLEVARDLIRRRFGQMGDARLRERKSLDLLARRGFPSDIARRALAVFEAD